MAIAKLKGFIERLSPWQRRALKFGAGALAGGALGLGYYLLVGCSSGGCPITSDPLVASAYGALFGGAAAAL